MITINRSITISIAFFLAMLTGYGQDQLCEGSLGDNIFLQGDFGSGYDVILREDPELAPGYEYTVRTPLPDGFYTITNNIGKWYENWPSWLPLKDRSPDPYGYMMVVNASYNPGVFYQQNITGVCENTLYEFSADVINVVARRTRNHILPNVSFLIDGQERYNTGRIRQDEEWHQVGFTFMTKPGQDEISLTLRNNSPGGSGNDLALDNISFRACGPYASISTNGEDVICEADDFPTLTAEIQSPDQRFVQWQIRELGSDEWGSTGLGSDLIYEVPTLTPGQYELRYVHAATPGNLLSEKCRAASDILELTVVRSKYDKFAFLEAGESISLGSQQITSPGVYRERFYSELGCDSLVELTVTGPDPETVALAAVPPDAGIPDEIQVIASPIPRKAVPQLVVILQESKSISCPDGSDAELTLNIKGGEAPFQFEWSNGSASSSLEGIGPGVYVVTVTDAGGRIATGSIRIQDATPLIVSFEDISGTMSGTKSGKARVVVENAVSSNQFRWDNGETTRSAVKLGQGTHSVTITDEMGCSVVRSVEIPERIMEGLSVEALRSGAAIRMDRLQFDADSSAIKSESVPTLSELYAFLVTNPDMVIEIGGHTNGLPESDYCDRLSTARAKSVAEWIVDKGIDADRVFYKGYGKRDPVATNQTVAGRKANQRVEVRMLTSGN